MQYAQLKNMFKLSSKISIYVPSTVNVNEKINTKKHVDECSKLLAECFGGSTCSPCVGCWMSPTAGLVKEKTTLVFAYCTDEQLNEHFDKVFEYVRNLCKELKQDCIALEINGEMYFID